MKKGTKSTAWSAADALHRLIQNHVGIWDLIRKPENLAVKKHQNNEILKSSGEQSSSWAVVLPQFVRWRQIVIFYAIIAGESCYCYHQLMGIWDLSEEAVRKSWAGRELTLLLYPLGCCTYSFLEIYIHYTLLCLLSWRHEMNRRSRIWNWNVLLLQRPRPYLRYYSIHSSSSCLLQPIFGEWEGHHFMPNLPSALRAQLLVEEIAQRSLARSRQLAPDILCLHSWPPSERLLQKQQMGRQLFQSMQPKPHYF